MQIKSMRIKAYRSWAVAENLPEEAIQRLKKIEHYHTLREQKVSQSLALEIIGWSRATFYRWQKRFHEGGSNKLITRSRRPHKVRTREWSKQQEQQVLHLRRRFPAWGKMTLWRILSRDHGFKASPSTVGRILAHAIRLGRIEPCSFYQGRIQSKRRRRFNGTHAKRWNYKMKAKQPGQMIQIDHMSVSLEPGTQIKEFKAICPISKQQVARAFSSATANNGKRFLLTMIDQFPFPVHSIQVDGGSEFMAEFEAECQRLNIPLFVLPPKRPQYNGCVERANGTSRSEFYPFYDGAFTIQALNQALQHYLNIYNHYRPHQALDLMTPNEYLQNLATA